MKTRFTEKQIVQILKEGATESGPSITTLCRKYGISTATYYNWRKKYQGMSLAEIKHLKALEAENSKLKRLVADLSLDNVCLKDLVEGKA